MSDIREEIARVIYEAPVDGEAGEWPPTHPDDLAYWYSRADALIEHFGIEEEWAVMAPDGGVMHEGPDAEAEARAQYDKWHHETEVLQRRYTTRYEDMEP